MASGFSHWFGKQLHFGSGTEPLDYFLSRWLFLRLLGVVYLAAFLSLWVQIDGLIGSDGVLPVADFLTAVRQALGSERYYHVPTLCWLNASDQFLTGLCTGGTVLSCMLILGLAPAPVLFLLWAFYLSLTVAGQVFLGYQWDALLLETGFLAIFFAPLRLWDRLDRAAPPSSVVLWLLRWLLFRLLFRSGMVKLLSDDPSWRSLTALQYHYETQPLPTWTSWYMHQLPGWFQQLSVLMTFAAELLLPLLIFGPRRCRHVACAGIVALQLLIAATGNFGFFNLLTIVLCVPLLEDGFFPARWRTRLARPGEPEAHPKVRTWSSWLTVPVAGLILIMSLVPFLQKCGFTNWWPPWLVRAYHTVASFHSVNNYGLFAVMTPERPEIIVEGSSDGRTWRPYEFKWKPGDPGRRPAFTGLHMPRLDWQMWFAALGRWQENPWFIHFLVRLRQGSPNVLKLLDRNPFAEQPPRYLRALLYQYHFTDSATRRQDGTWWRREKIDFYCPVLPPKNEPND
jgi:hypothetical protein